MGDGIAIIPSEGALYAPVDGEVTLLFETNHALGMKTDKGVEVLFHIGIDTVQLEGQYFYPKVQAGDRVQAGDLLIEFDVEKSWKQDTIQLRLLSSRIQINMILRYSHYKRSIAKIH